ncbi:MAG: hypothetical protein AAGF56_06950 [Pseudomonadota bacterium]
MPQQNYRSRTNDVRKSARAHLSALRQARVAQRDALAQSVPPKVTEPDVTPPDVTEDGDMLEDIAQRSVANVAATADTDAIDVAPDLTDMHPESDATQADHDIDEGGAEAALTTGSTAAMDDWQTSPLAQLPGAGPGLVWVLTQCGVHDMADLADRDPAELSEAMGVIGQIIDVSTWVDFARHNVAN